MKKICFVAVLVATLVGLMVAPVQAQNRIVLKTGTLEASKIDTVTVDLSKKFDLFGVFMTTDSIANIQRTFEVRSTSGNWVSVLVDTCNTSTTTGAGFAKTLRGFATTTVPWGIDVMRVRVNKLSSGNGGVGKAYVFSINGIPIRQ